MRRETNFVLEKAAWPALVLEESGAIRRANKAAVELFGPPVKGASAALASIWTEGNLLSAEKFLSASESASVKLRLKAGDDQEFLARPVPAARDGENYFIVQLFKPSAAALAEPPPPKVEPAPPPPPPPAPIFVLEEASWPALHIEHGGLIIGANRAAAEAFGSSPDNGDQFSILWLPENKDSAEQFLQATHQEPQPVKLRLKTGTPAAFLAQVSPAGPDAVMVQLFAEPAPPPPPPLPPLPPAPAIFVLEEASWPALHIEHGGQIISANRAAAEVFGSIDKIGQFSILWLPENKGSAHHFLQATHKEPQSLKLRLKTGKPAAFLALVSPASPDAVVVQLFDEPVALQKVPEAPLTMAVERPTPSVAPIALESVPTAPTLEPNLNYKQKLECALQLSRSVALDFNNALTSILGHASLLLRKTEAGNPWRESLVEIEKSAAKAAEVASDLASFSRQEKEARVQSAGNLNVLLERAIAGFQTEYPQITWAPQLERRLYTATFDEAKMQQALVKILENAIQSIKAKSGRVSVQTHNLELTEATQDRSAKLNPGNYVCAEISDSGEGIAEDVLPRIFEPFFTTKGKNHRGLGLAWVYGIVTNHGGAVAVSSKVGVGTSVRIYLPATKKVVKHSVVDDDNLGGNQTILIVDDEDLLLRMGNMVLSSYGYNVLTANSGAKALEIFSNSKQVIHLMITDLLMPGMSGRELTEQVQRLSPQTRIIWSSGYLWKAGGQDEEAYLQKPFNSQDLLRKVKEALMD